MALKIGLLIGGLLFLLLGLAFAPTLLSFAATSGADANIGSFSGTKSMNDLAPLIYYVGVIVGGLGSMSVGGAGVFGKGPVGAR